MPILGIIASSILGDTSAYFPIATTTLTTTTSTVTFSSIPQTYKHLQIRAIAKTDRATYIQDGINMRFNGDSGNNYSRHAIWGNGTSVNADADTSFAQIQIGMGAAGGGGTSMFAGMVLDILDYNLTTKNKTTRALAGADDNGSVTGGTRLYFASGAWYNTSAITSITLTPQVGSNFVQYSSFALYGIKG